MALFILDMGSGNTCRNDKDTIRRMIHEVAELDFNGHDVVLKWQLFKDAPPNIPLTHESFEYAYKVANNLCLETTASVFDIDSLRFLMQYSIPFVKIACRPELYYLMEVVQNICDQREDWAPVKVYISTASGAINLPDCVKLACVSNYPATIEEYETRFTPGELQYVSDHTVGWRLYEKYRPYVIEKHFVHERVDGNPDAGQFAVTAAELAEGFHA
jgi:sialic acid synthase SpsE